MKKNIIRTVLLVFAMLLVVGCSNTKKEAIIEKNEQGEVTVTTESGEKIVVDETTERVENKDGTATVVNQAEKPTTQSNSQPSSDKKEDIQDKTEEKIEQKEPLDHEHSYDYMGTEKQATCTETGVERYTCYLCGDSYTKTISAKGHDSSSNSWFVEKEATCSAKGVEARACAYCEGCDYKEIPINADNHSYTWNTDGNMRTAKCSGCGKKGIVEYKYGEVWGYMDDTSAEELMWYIGEQRKESVTTVHDDWGNCIGSKHGTPLIWNNALERKAKNRAAEVAKEFSHGGELHECIAWGYGSAMEAYHAWCYSKTHAQAMTNFDYTIGATACFWYDSDDSGVNLTPIWILELGY